MCNQMLSAEANAPILSIETLVSMFKDWLDDNPCDLISGNIVGVAPHIFVEIENQLYRIHSDTTRQGVEVFVNNYDNNELITIPNRNGVINRATNNEDETGIPGFYMYIHPRV
jgi:hypothetical protein